MANFYNLEWINNNISSEFEAAKFLQDFNIICEVKKCENEHNMSLKCFGKFCLWVCSKKICRKRVSVRKDTWLKGTNLPLSTIIKFIYCWSEELTTIKFAQKELKLSNKTTVTFNNYLREVRLCSSNNNKNNNNNNNNN